jgi:phospholipase/lecithinase/hemolysin
MEHRAVGLDWQDGCGPKEGVKESMGIHPRTRLRWTSVFTAGIVLVFGNVVRADPITSIVSFGDSLSDVGNASIASGGTQPAPTADYYQGRYSNGPVWVENLAKDLGVSVPTASLAGGTDYAFGGAQTGYGTSTVEGAQIPNIGTQIAMYLGAGNLPTPTQLFTVWGGANDFLLGGQTNPAISVQNIAQEITTLADAGAKQFLIPNLPMLGQIPLATQTLSIAQQQGLNQLSMGFNTLLQSEITQLQKSLGVQIHLLDIGSLFNSVMANPANYGITNITGSAINASLSGNGFLFWDQEHPTTAVDAIIGQVGADSVPEPSAILVFAAAFGTLAYRSARRRHKGPLPRPE